MSYNPNQAGAPALMAPMIQDWLETSLVAKAIGSSVNYEGVLQKGKSIDIPYVPDGLVEDYNQGTDMSFTAYEAVSDPMLINISRAANFTLGKNELAQLADKNYRAKLTKRHAFRIAADMDQKGLNKAITLAGNTEALGTLSSSNIFQKFANLEATLSRNDADGTRIIVLPPEHVSLLAQSELANGFNTADAAHKNGFVGPSASGFKVYKSNNLPVSVVLTVDTQPTAGDTFTIAGVTWTCVADGAVCAAGEIKIGANLADFKAILVTAINGTTPPSVGDYGTLSVFNRRKYTNAAVTAAAFVGDDCTITGFGRLNPSETFAAVTNIFGSETGSILAGDQGCLKYVLQRMPEVDSVPLQNRPQEVNISISTLYGLHVFELDKPRLVNGTFTF